MKRFTKREKLVYTTLISLFIAILLLGIVTDVYAKYTTTILGQGNIEIAKWEFKVNSKKESQKFEINFVTDGSETKIFPGSKGSVQIYIENNSNVQAKANISLQELFLNTAIESNVLKIYKDEEFTQEVDISTKDLELNLDSESDKIVKLYWKWVPDETIDQIIAENYVGFTLNATITGEQTQLPEDPDYSLRIVDKE